MAAERATRLSKLLTSYIHGQRSPKSANDGKLFLEAISGSQDVASCVERLVGSKHAMESLKLALRFDITSQFFNSAFKDFVAFLMKPYVGQACGGDLLKQLLAVTVHPPTLWNALVLAHSNQELDPEGELSFAWLMLELLSWTEKPPINIDTAARNITEQQRFLAAGDRDLRALGYRIKHVLLTKTAGVKQDEFGPGGRHDNDHHDFRKIAIYPTDDELMSKQPAFYRPANAINQQLLEDRAGMHIDNQFRLLREDFLAELRIDVSGPSSNAKNRRPRLKLQGLSLAGSYCGTARFKTPFALALSVRRGLEQLSQRNTAERKTFLKDNPKFLKHQAFGCVLGRGRIVTFATLLRVDELLTEGEPAIVLRTPDRTALEKLLMALKVSDQLEFLMVDTPAFAYEPVLRCLQSTVELPFREELFAISSEEVEAAVRISPIAPADLIEAIETDEDLDMKTRLCLQKSVSLDSSQRQSLLSGLRQTVSLIQGPPGTGKSFIGALLAKALMQETAEKVLVICYTNHALDQFLEDLLDIGIPAGDMVRLGAKSTNRTEPLQLFKQAFRGSRPYSVINASKEEAEEHETSLRTLVTSLKTFSPSKHDIVEHLEFSEEDSAFFSAFQNPLEDSDMQIVGKKGKRVGEHYLYDRWRHGHDAGALSELIPNEHAWIWAMDRDSRHAKIRTWTQQLLQDKVNGIGSLVEAYDRSENTLREAWSQKDGDIIQTKRIIACTTTAAAKYTKQLRCAAPGIIIVEEAGEILESHILTALSPSTKQLVLIGDHKQLRPKVNNFALTVEKDEGYDLNRSLFERLILAGFPHTTLRQQHRMCPEISTHVRDLTYPDLVDARATLNRGPIRGLCGRVIFIDHRNPEVIAPAVADRRDMGKTVSKQNQWEVSMILKIVRYMAQQGYGTGDQAVLTPYLGQLSLLRLELSREHDPVLNDLDSFDLVRAGLMSSASAAQTKRPIKISTIDNYQGEECDVIIASLTRSNADGDIGFMASPERLNVLLSRARRCLITVGNTETFLASRKGVSTWKPFLQKLSENDEIFNGLPAKCQRHPERQVVLKQPADFDLLCPAGGCSADCEAQLNCGLHKCPQKCHPQSDHSKMACEVRVSGECPKKHKMTWRCARPLASCPTCDAHAREAVERRRRDEQLDKVRQQKQEEYARRLSEIQGEIEHERRIMREHREDEDRDNTLRQQRMDLENVRRQKIEMEKEKGASVPSAELKHPGGLQPAADKPPPLQSKTEAHKGSESEKSVAAQDWQHQKKYQGASNTQLDELMSMIGLENVKEEFLDVKAKIDLIVRQNVSLSKERFGACLLGNPGTGKTTVARLYGAFLASVGALPGSDFVETTGAKLAHEGVQGCQKILDSLKRNGGGALFIDEAYQLTSGSSFGGGAVLDFLLAEVENLTGKVVFILAGYNKNMESFFAHNPGLPSRFPRTLQFADYEDDEILDILDYRLTKQYAGRMQVDGGVRGLYARIVARRLGRGRGKAGFGNARAVENAISVIAARQAKRISRERRKGKTPDDLFLTPEDMIGPKPADVLSRNKAWLKLQGLTGLSSVKDSVSALFDSIKYNYHRELEEKPIMDFSLNKVFLGSPGTGKTTVAKLYGQILADLGLLSTNEVIVKTPADFVGNVLGASEANTKAILDAAIGKVLVLDEAYGLCSKSDPYKAAVIDTIVAEVQSIPGDDRCVLLLGYKEQMEEMMQSVNPGLARRFPIDSGFLFEDFTDAELAVIFDAKLRSQAFTTSDKARGVALDVLGRMRNRPNFGNAGQVDILLNDAKMRQQKRIGRERIAPNAILEAEDFDPNHKRAENAAGNLETLFEGVVGCEGIVQQMHDYQNIAENAKRANMDPRSMLPFNFLFRGPPGTGKTTTARKMGHVYCDMGMLATAEVVECSAKDLIGEYVGQTGPKAQKLIEGALGKVLFVDEAYRLGDGPFAKEAVDELVDCITKPRFLSKLVIILAGYVDEINTLMDVNPGLSSRFPETVDFRELAPEACLNLLRLSLNRNKQIDTLVLSTPSEAFRARALAKFGDLSLLDNFANGRDVETIARGIVGAIMKSAQPHSLAVTEDLVIQQIDRLILERRQRAASSQAISAFKADGPSLPVRTKNQDRPTTASSIDAATCQSVEQQVTQAGADNESQVQDVDPEEDDDEPVPVAAIRDAGVSDAVWAQLQADKRKADEEQREKERLEKEAEELRRFLKACADAKRQRELEEIERKTRELQEKLRREAQAKKKLAQLGRCPVGYAWIRQSGGYRCAGGSHWISDSEVSKLCG